MAWGAIVRPLRMRRFRPACGETPPRLSGDSEMKVIVSGSKGFVGSHLVRDIEAEGHEAVGGEGTVLGAHVGHNDLL